MKSSDHKKENAKLLEAYEKTNVDKYVSPEVKNTEMDTHKKHPTKNKKLRKKRAQSYEDTYKGDPSVERLAKPTSDEHRESNLPVNLKNIIHKKVSQALNEDLHDDRPSDGTIDIHGTAVLQSAASYLYSDLIHNKVQRWEDLVKDAQVDVIPQVISDLQKQGALMRGLDYGEMADEREEVRQSVERYLMSNFDELIDVAEEMAVEKGDRAAADSGIDPADVERWFDDQT